MIGKLILTHGGLARELLAAANVISGSLYGFEALSLDWSDGFDEARGKVARGPGAAGPGGGGADPDRHVRRHALQHLDDLLPAGQVRGADRREPADGPPPGLPGGRRRAPSPSSPTGCRTRGSAASAWPGRWRRASPAGRAAAVPAGRRRTHDRARDGDRQPSGPPRAGRGEAGAHRRRLPDPGHRRKDGEEVDAKSILGVLLLAAGQGSLCHRPLRRQDEEEALRAVTTLIANRFDEES